MRVLCRQCSQEMIYNPSEVHWMAESLSRNPTLELVCGDCGHKLHKLLLSLLDAGDPRVGFPWWYLPQYRARFTHD